MVVVVASAAAVLVYPSGPSKLLLPGLQPCGVDCTYMSPHAHATRALKTRGKRHHDCCVRGESWSTGQAGRGGGQEADAKGRTGGSPPSLPRSPPTLNYVMLYCCCFRHAPVFWFCSFFPALYRGD